MLDMLHAVVNADTPQAFNTWYLELNITYIYGEYVVTHQLCKSHKLYVKGKVR